MRTALQFQLTGIMKPSEKTKLQPDLSDDEIRNGLHNVVMDLYDSLNKHFENYEFFASKDDFKITRGSCE